MSALCYWDITFSEVGGVVTARFAERTSKGASTRAAHLFRHWSWPPPLPLVASLPCKHFVLTSALLTAFLAGLVNRPIYWTLLLRLCQAL